jgi:tRNA (guanine37-N1)-methyltransferase
VRIDVVSIFPDFFAPLSLSLAGKAVDAGLLDVFVHDLRAFTHDRHRTVDDTPYGGGAGMVMKPEPWGEALDAALATAPASLLVVPTPAGRPFTQATAERLSAHDHLVFACGRYEGIDQRVVDHYRSAGVPAEELSIGDYVVNGGEVAALVMIEAVVRLLPGFIGNPESLAEESHGADGLLEYPVFTKPPVWRGLEVPEVLLSGDHRRIGTWRREQSRRRTVERRPDLLPPSALSEDVTVRPAVPGDAGEIMTVQRAAFGPLQRENPTVDVDELVEGLDSVRGWLGEGVCLVAMAGSRLVGAVWAKERGGRWRIARLAVVPDLQGRGLGRMLVARAEELAPAELGEFEVLTGKQSSGVQRFYRRCGYRVRGEVTDGVVRLLKRWP